MRNLKKGKSPYQRKTIGSSSHSVDYQVKNTRTGWKRFYTKYSATGKPRFY